jgi:inward rectifier potassium channel
MSGSVPPQSRRPDRDASSAVRKGAPSSTRSDLYSYFLSGSWTRVFVASSILFVLANVFFAALYLLEPGAIGGVARATFADAFYFSVQTMATIGYGVLHPNPVSTLGNLIVSAESLISIVGVAVMTGLIVAKASRTSAGVLFSQVITVAPRNGVPTLMIRLANARGNEIVDARIQVVVLKDEVSPEGHHMRRLHDLQLERSNTPLFALGWTVMHVIDEKSPLREVDFTRPGDKMGLIMVTMTGHDGTFGQTTYARYSYQPEDIRHGERFVDVMSQLEDGRMMIDLTKFHATVKIKPS